MVKIKSVISVTLLLFTAFIMRSQDMDKLKIALEYLDKNTDKLKIEKSDIENFKVNYTYTDENSQATYFYLDQTLNGIPIKNAMMVMVMNKQGKIVHTGNSCVPDISKIKTENATSVNPAALVISAAKHLGVERPEEPSLLQRSNNGDLTFSKTNFVKSEIKARPVYEFNETANRLILCYELTLDMAESADFWQISIAQGSGEYVAKNNLTVYCNHEHNKWQHAEDCNAVQLVNQTFTQKSTIQELLVNTPKYRVYPFPAESPNHGTHQLITDPSIKAASPEGWNMIDGIGINITRGNNTFTFLDEDDNDYPDPGTTVRPADSLNFDFSHDINKDPGLFKEAAQVNLFYANNMMHDISYLYGFTEVAGNFQDKNYSGMGKGADGVSSQAFDGFKAVTPKFNNANFSTPVDGTSGRMQMFLWDRGISNSAVKIIAPAEISNSISSFGTASFGPRIPWSNEAPVQGLVSVVNQPGSVFPTQACGPVSANLTGRIALVDRGECNFIEKVSNAQKAGAKACIVCNVAGINGGNGDEIISMGAPQGSAIVINIPSVFLKKSDCDRIRAVIARGTEVEMQLQETLLEGPRYRDGSFDNGVIAHEYGHGISNRLTGGPNNSSCLNNDEQMGEGWSDFFSLITSVRPGDKGELKRGIGTFSVNQPPDGDGLRRFPYSTDLKINPQTYNSIKGTTAPHPVGEVWADMLWDLYWAMADKYGFDPDIFNTKSGNGKAIQLVMEGMKIQACRPGFIEGRDAILGADLLLFSGENQCLIWEVFAKRGLGYFASGGSANNRNDGTEDFESLPTCIKKLKISKKIPDVVTSGSTIDVELKAVNHIPATVKNVFIDDIIPQGYEYVEGSASRRANFKNGKLNISLGTMEYEAEVNITYKLKVVSQKSATTILYNIDNGVEGFDIVPKIGFDTWRIVSEGANSGKDAFFIPVTTEENDHSMMTPAIKLSSEKPVLKFLHKYNTRPVLDGGYVSVSKDNGATWKNLDKEFIVNGPKETINYSTFAIPELKGFTGSTGGKYISSFADLSQYKNENVMIRFRFGTEDSTSFENGGWWIDDIEIMDALSGTTLACINDEVKDKEACTAGKVVIIDSGNATTNTYEEEIVKQFEIFPNPTNDKINIITEFKVATEGLIRIFSYDGNEKINKSVFLIEGRNDISVDVNSLKNGMYFIELKTRQGSSIKKLLKVN
jgi:extracellular elastinolytic metalloproteinase